MPSYRTRTPKPKKRSGGTRKHKGLPQDRRKLLQFVARGSVKDYERLAAAAKRLRSSRPPYIDERSLELLAQADKVAVVDEVQQSRQEHQSPFLEALSWLFEKIPLGNWAWPIAAAQSAIKSQKTGALNETDEQYARLVGATYGVPERRPYVLDHWRRQAAYDTEYCSVWDSPDNHRLIAVRGTQDAGDMLQDALLALLGHTSTNVST